MALTKRVLIGSIEVVGSTGHIQVRTDTIIEEDGVELSKSYHRHCIHPGGDTSNEDAQVAAVAKIAHTVEVVAKYVEAQRVALSPNPALE